MMKFSEDQSTNTGKIEASKGYWRDYFSSECDFYIKYHSMGDDVKILSVKSFPKNQSTNTNTIILIPGWFSLPNGWTSVIKYLSERNEIVYLETREKRSSIIPHKKIDFSVSQLARDLRLVLEDLNIRVKDSVIMGSSLGGSLLMEYLATTPVNPQRVVMVSPNPDYKLPPVLGRILLAMPLFMFRIVKKYVKWHVLTFRIDSKKEPEQAEKYTEVLEAADPWKLRSSARQVTKFNGWGLLPEISANVILVGASSDKLHGLERSKKIAELIPSSKFLDFGSNKAIHEESFAKYLLELANEESLLSAPKIETKNTNKQDFKSDEN